jgi:hypothetical protein
VDDRLGQIQIVCDLDYARASTEWTSETPSVHSCFVVPKSVSKVLLQKPHRGVPIERHPRELALR